MKALFVPLLVYLVGLGGCHAQGPSKAASSESVSNLSPDLIRRIDLMIRSRSEVAPDYVMSLDDRRRSEFPGYDQITVHYAASGSTSRPINLLLSNDDKVLVVFNKLDLGQDPKEKVPTAGRPARGGTENAPVLLVVFDDLECPFCGQMHTELFPAITKRYGSQVSVVYRDFPLVEIHPWAMRAATDSNCLGSLSTDAYWNFVDYVHAHAESIGGKEHSVAKAISELDELAQEEGTRKNLDKRELESCLLKQSDTPVKDSLKLGEALGVHATPTLFINGEQISGAIPITTVYRIIDQALIAAGQTPPPAIQSASGVETRPVQVQP